MGELSVITANLCLPLSGIRNRYLASQLACAGLVASVAVLQAAALRWGLPYWLLALLLLPVHVLSTFLVGVPLGRLLGHLLLLPLGWSTDFQRERVDAFLEFLSRPENRADVVCLQECYDGLVLPGGYVQHLIKGARAIGFEHSAVPGCWPSFPATLAQNSGLVILSRRPVLSSTPLTFGLSAESGNVNRGALHAELEGGVHVFTCHLTPKATSGGVLVSAFRTLFDAARNAQAGQLTSFIKRQAAEPAAVVLAGDLNLDISFPAHGKAADQASSAADVLAALAAECGLREVCAAVRGKPDEAPGSIRCLRPTFGYCGEALGCAGPREMWVTSICEELSLKCEDAVLFRGFTPLAVQELPLEIAKPRRPRPEVTHMSDHWAVRAVLRRE